MIQPRSVKLVLMGKNVIAVKESTGMIQPRSVKLVLMENSVLVS